MSTKNKTSNGHPWIWTIVGIAVTLTVLYIIIHISLTKFTRHNQEYEVPDFYGMQLEEARSLAAENGFRLEVTDSVYSKTLARGAIFRQNPTKGSMVKKGRRIILTVNATISKTVEMPLLTGFSLRQARTALAAKGLQLERLKYVYDMATNNVLGQEYNGRSIKAGTLIPQDSKITLIVGQNPQDGRASIPDVVGYSYKMARDIVWDNSFNIASCVFDETVRTYSDTLTSAVYRQSPAPTDSAYVERGSSVVLYFTKDLTRIARKASAASEDEE